MSQPPDRPKIYHFTHVDNLPGILQAEGLWSDAERIRRGFDVTLIGMAEIKRRRLEEIAVSCHPGTMVGDYVPFYLCPRSVMLCIMWYGNHPEVTYRGGQEPLIHLEADLADVTRWADGNGVRWACSDRNAGAYLADFFTGLDKLDRIDWQAIAARDFRSAEVKEGKQAEFLLHRHMPWRLFTTVGVHNQKVAEQVATHLAGCEHRPTVTVQRDWYF